MAEDRYLNRQRLAGAMDTTRRSIENTLDELKERVRESTDWKRQLRRHPATSLWLAVACGLALAAILIPAACARGQRSTSPAGGRGGPAIGMLSRLGVLASLLSQLSRLAGRPGVTRS